mmetsp:Transcript_61592/g.163171  ORF Transcript_61592/g.163171 Transcript_61592/m.163171 type:complete len:122 (-) Transcript_61592:326-691(-)
MCEHITASIAVDTGDMAVLEPSGYILTAVAAKGLEITSAGFRCALEPSRPSCCLAPLARAALQDPWPGSSDTRSSARTGRDRASDVHMLSTTRRKAALRPAEGSALTLKAAIYAAATRHAP